MLCAALSASAQPALLRPRGAAQPATTHRTASVPGAAAAGRASRCAAPLAADIDILRIYSSRRTSVRVAASAGEPAASPPDVRPSEQQQATVAQQGPATCRSGAGGAPSITGGSSGGGGSGGGAGGDSGGAGAGGGGGPGFAFFLLVPCLFVTFVYMLADTVAWIYNAIAHAMKPAGPYPGIRVPRVRPIPGAVVTADNAHRGLLVRRGPDWDRIHPNWIAAGQDGGPGGNGEVVSLSPDGKVAEVCWRVTGRRLESNITGKRGYRELVVAPAEAQRKWPWEWVWRKL